MIYAEVYEDGTIRYPAFPVQENPGTSFRLEWPGGIADGRMYEVVSPTEAPLVDSRAQRTVEIGPARVSGVLSQSWMVIDLSQAEKNAKLAEYRAELSCSRFQALAALHNTGLLVNVETMMADPATDPILKLAWVNMPEFHRANPAVIGIGSALGLTETEMDDLFETARQITV